MSVKISITPNVPPQKNRVLLAIKETNFNNANFTEAELGYIKSCLDKDIKFFTVNHMTHFTYVIIVDYSKSHIVILENIRKEAAKLTGAISQFKIPELYIESLLTVQEELLACAEGFLLANYQFLKYFGAEDRKKKKSPLENLYLVSEKLKDADVNEVQNVVNAVCIARDLVNEPASTLDSEALSKSFEEMGAEAGFSVTILHKDEIEKQKMGGILGVNRGSEKPPTFSILEWKPTHKTNRKPIVLVGKGVVYDSGGLSLKPTPNSMDYMKCDMAGGAAVGAILYALAKNNIALHVIGLVPSTDNRVDATSYAPGDVLHMYSGHTVEVLNTDAEGRLILADALHYAKQYNPQLVIDMATLTGSAAAAVGVHGTVMFSTADDKVNKKLIESSNNTYERLVEFPLWDEYDEEIKSDIADMKNVGSSYAGAITAAKFLQRYVNYPWIHLDIAGRAFSMKPDSYRGKGGTGIQVRCLYHFLKSLANK